MSWQTSSEVDPQAAAAASSNGTSSRRPPTRRPRLKANLEGDMEPSCEDVHGTAIAVVRRVDDRLVDGGQREEVVELQLVVDVAQHFGPVMKRAVADDEPVAAPGQVTFVPGGEAAGHHGHADQVEGAMPARPVLGDADRDGAVDLGERPRFVVAIVPGEAQEGAESGGELLIDGDGEPVLVAAIGAR